MSSSTVAGALILAGLVGGLAMFVIGGSRRLSHGASLTLTWSAPVFCVACLVASNMLEAGASADAVAIVAWSAVALLVFGYVAGRLLGRLPRRGPPGGGAGGP